MKSAPVKLGLVGKPVKNCILLAEQNPGKVPGNTLNRSLKKNFLSFLTEIYTLLVPLGRTVYPDDAKL